MGDIRWQRYPRAAECELARAWLVLQDNLGLAENTLDAYARAVEEFLAFSATKEVPVVAAMKDHIAACVRDLTSRPNPSAAAGDKAGRTAAVTIANRLVSKISTRLVE